MPELEPLSFHIGGCKQPRVKAPEPVIPPVLPEFGCSPEKQPLYHRKALVMPAFLKKLIASPAVRKAFYSLLLALAAAAGFSAAGCASYTPAQQARVDLFACRVAALEPVVGSVLDASKLVQDLYAGKADLGAALAAMQVGEREGRVLLEALRACSEDMPEGEAS